MNMGRFRTFSVAWFVLWLSMLLSGCAIAVVTDVETYDAVATDRYSHSLEDAVPVGAIDAESSSRCFRIESSLICFYPALRGVDVKAVGLVVPMLPAPGPGQDYGGDFFYLEVRVRPGNTGLVTFRPNDFLIRREGDEDAIEPQLVSRCDDSESGLDVVQVYGYPQCFRIEYPVLRADLEQFLMVPAVVDVDNTLHVLPDLQWSQSSYRVNEVLP